MGCREVRNDLAISLLAQSWLPTPSATPLWSVRRWLFVSSVTCLEARALNGEERWSDLSSSGRAMRPTRRLPWVFCDRVIREFGGTRHPFLPWLSHRFVTHSLRFVLTLVSPMMSPERFINFSTAHVHPVIAPGAETGHGMVNVMKR